MKALFSLAVAAISFASLTLEGSVLWPKERYNERLKNVIAPTADSLTQESLLSGQPIHASDIDKTKPDDGHAYCHHGYYANAFIATFWGVSYRNDAAPDIAKLHEGTIGKQRISFYTDAEMSYSADWWVEEYEGAQFVIFQHDGFKVYTNANEQFIIGDQG